MDLTTEEENQRTRIEYLESLLNRLYQKLQGGKAIEPNSRHHKKIGICIGKIDPKAKKWGLPSEKFSKSRIIREKSGLAC